MFDETLTDSMMMGENTIGRNDPSTASLLKAIEQEFTGAADVKSKKPRNWMKSRDQWRMRIHSFSILHNLKKRSRENKFERPQENLGLRVTTIKQHQSICSE